MTTEFHFAVDIYTVLLVYEQWSGLNTEHEGLVSPFRHTIPLFESKVGILSSFNPSAWSDGHCPHTVNITCRGVTGTARIQ